MYIFQNLSWSIELSSCKNFSWENEIFGRPGLDLQMFFLKKNFLIANVFQCRLGWTYICWTYKCPSVHTNYYSIDERRWSKVSAILNQCFPPWNDHVIFLLAELDTSPNNPSVAGESWSRRFVRTRTAHRPRRPPFGFQFPGPTWSFLPSTRRRPTSTAPPGPIWVPFRLPVAVGPFFRLPSSGSFLPFRLPTCHLLAVYCSSEAILNYASKCTKPISERIALNR